MINSPTARSRQLGMNCRRLIEFIARCPGSPSEQWNNNCKTTLDISRSFEDLQKQHTSGALRVRKNTTRFPLRWNLFVR